MAVAVFRNCDAAAMRFHVEVADIHIEVGVEHVEADFVAEEGKDEIVEANEAVGSGDDGPLFGCDVEGTKKARGDAVFEKEFAGEAAGHGSGTGFAAGFGENSASDAGGEFLAHGPERETDAVPAEIAEAAEGFHGAVDANVVFEEFGIAVKAEGGGDAFDFADAGGVDFSGNFLEAFAVHEHDAVHELNAVLATSIEHHAKMFDV